MTNLAPYNNYNAKTLGPQWDTGFYLMKAQSVVDGRMIDGWSEFCMIDGLVNRHFVWFNVHGEQCVTDWEIITSNDLLIYAVSDRFADWVRGHAQ